MTDEDPSRSPGQLVKIRQKFARFDTRLLLLAIALLLVTLAAVLNDRQTAGDSEASPVNTEASPVDSESPEPVGTAPVLTGAALPPPGSGMLSLEEACQRELEISAEYTMSDEETAAAFRILAAETADASLSAAIGREADAFARHDEAINGAEVNLICGR